MIGDGVNDAAALQAADIGIGVAGGAEASLASADIYFEAPGLHPVLEVVDGARRSYQVIRQNIGFSLAYNAVAIGFAMAGWVSPLVAALIMPISSFVVLTRAATFRFSPGETGPSSTALPKSPGLNAALPSCSAAVDDGQQAAPSRPVPPRG